MDLRKVHISARARGKCRVRKRRSTMAQYRNPFDSSHVAPQQSNTRAPVTTRHRDVEKARQKVAKEGQSPNSGRFRQVVPQPKRDAHGNIVVWPTHDPYLTSYTPPGGSEVVTVERERPKIDPRTQEPIPPSKEPHERRLRVNGVEFSEPAGKLYLKARYGIQDESCCDNAIYPSSPRW